VATAQARRVTNADARLLFLNSAIRKAQWANPAQTPALSTTLSVVLPKAGIARALLVTCSLPITIGTAVTVPSPKAPFNVFSNIHLQDYAGIDRVNSSAYMLGELQRYKRRMWEPSSSYPYVAAGNTTTSPYTNSDAAYPFGMTAPYAGRSGQGGTLGGTTDFREVSRWSIPTAVASANFVFSLWIPVAFGADDPRGALLLDGAAA
jgi:hypothetical protein